MARTDIHRQSVVVPSDYEYVMSYSLSTTEDGWPVPSFGVNCELDYRVTEKLDGGSLKVTNGAHAPDGQCCVIGLRHHSEHPHAPYGGTGKCTFCGAAFVYGSVFQHRATKEYVHVGHICAQRVGLAIDDPRFEKQRLSFVTKVLQKERREAFCAKHPGMAEALAMSHPVLRDMSHRLDQYGGLTEKQVAFALRLAEEQRNPPKQEPHVSAPEGRITWEGEVIKIKPSEWGERLIIKCTEDPNGVWLAMGTLPKSLREVKRGDRVRLTATLKPGRDAHFAFYKRPAGGVILSKEQA